MNEKVSFKQQISLTRFLLVNISWAAFKPMNSPIPSNPPPDAPGQNKEFTIIVNARPKTVTEKRLTFDQIVALAFGTPNYDCSVYTITYQKGEDKKPKGSLVPGESVNLKEGMIFDVIRTDKS